MLVEVDLSNIIPPELVGLHPSALEPLVRDIATAARAEWIRVAGAELRTSRRDYLRGIQEVVFAGNTATVSLVGQLPNIIEQGMGRIDMRDTLLGPNVPVAPEGRFGKHLTIRPSGAVGFYRAIPFRHATPGTGGAVGQAMGEQYQGHEAVEDAGQLGQRVYERAKKLKATTSDPYKGTKWGGRLPVGLAPLLKPHHKTDIFAGMVRERKTYSKARQSKYVTFRTISTLIRDESWIRKATSGRHFSKKVSRFVDEIAPKALSAYVQNWGGG
jgi:hypothetical protein